MYSEHSLTAVAVVAGATVGLFAAGALSPVTAAFTTSGTTVQPVVSHLPTAAPLRSARLVPSMGLRAGRSTTDADVPEAVSYQATSGLPLGLMAIASAVGAAVSFAVARLASTTAADSPAGDVAVPGRRQALATGFLAGATGTGLLAARPAAAAYGESANVFGKKPAVNQVFAVSGAGWSGIMPGKYNPSKEREFPGTVARWEDNFDAISCASVIVIPGVNGLGDLDATRTKYVDPLLGQQSFEGDTISEGGFAPGKVASSALLDQRVVEKNGKQYYEYQLLTRTADGDEGGKHQLFSLAVASDGRLIILKHQAGDKRWFKGLDKPILESIAAFTVA